MLLSTKDTIIKMSEIIAEETGWNFDNLLEKWAIEAEENNKSIADYIPSVGYNVTLYNVDKIKAEIIAKAEDYIRSKVAESNVA